MTNENLFRVGLKLIGVLVIFNQVPPFLKHIVALVDILLHTSDSSDFATILISGLLVLLIMAFGFYMIAGNLEWLVKRANLKPVHRTAVGNIRIVPRQEEQAETEE